MADTEQNRNTKLETESQNPIQKHKTQNRIPKPKTETQNSKQNHKTQNRNTKLKTETQNQKRKYKIDNRKKKKKTVIKNSGLARLLILIRRLVIYPRGSAIQRLNNRGQEPT